MPYEYRKLSPKEREEIVALRKRRGYPLHAPPHPFREAGSYLITAANYEHALIMAAPERRDDFQEILINRFKDVCAEVIAWVILPNHYHILINVESLELVSNVLRQVHGVTSRDWNLQDGLTRKRRVWYHYVDRAIRNETHLHQALNYIHYNPVKHGLVDDVYEWPWSSLFMYIEERGKAWPSDIWNRHAPPTDFGKGWDE